MIEIQPVISNASISLWLDSCSMPNVVKTPDAEGYSATAFQDDDLNTFVLRKAPDMSRLLFVERPFRQEPQLRDISGAELAALGSLAGQTDEQIITALRQ